MESIKDKVAIIGMGCTKFGERWDTSADDLIIEAAYEAYEDAGIESKDIQAAWVGTLQTSSSGVSLSAPLKLKNIPITRVENMCATGTEALRNALFAVACKAYDLVLVVGFEKLKDLGYAVLGGGYEHPVFNTGYSTPGTYALAATRYFQEYGVTKETLAKIAVKNHHNGCLHPKAHFQREITVEQVMKAPIIGWPLGLFDCCPRTDGAAAAIICRKEDASKYKKKDDYILVKGLGIAAGTAMGKSRTGYDYLHFDENLSASRQAYEQTGIKDPLKELDLAIVHDCFTITELIIYGDLGFCPANEAKDYVDDGVFKMEGELPVNTDGGLKAFGHPQGASGLRMICEVYNQLLGRAGPRQLKSPRLGLTHNLGGAPGVAVVSCVGIFGL